MTSKKNLDKKKTDEVLATKDLPIFLDSVLIEDQDIDQKNIEKMSFTKKLLIAETSKEKQN